MVPRPPDLPVESPRSIRRPAAVPGARPWNLGLAVLLVVAFAVRAWMGAAFPEVGRFWDERYSLENAAALLETGRLEPVNAYHPSLAHLPQAAVLGAARSLCARTPLCDDPVLRNGRMTPLGYRLSRWLQAVYGALSLVALYAVGHRLFGRPEGLLAALLLAAVPWHVRQSAIAKPDILLLLAVIAAFGAALWVVRRPTLRRHMVGGLTVGLAAAAKYNGFAAGIPLAVATAAGARRDPRRVARLAAAAAAALALFLVLDPHLLTRPEMLGRDFGETLEHYERQGAASGVAGPAALLGHAVASLVSPAFHGALVGIAALLGLLLLAASATRRDLAPAEREGRLMLASFPLLYALVYAAATSNPSPHNWLPLTPFTSLAAAWLGVAAWRRLAAPLPAQARRRVGAGALVVLGGIVATASARYVYPATLPTTVRQAEAHVLDRLPRRLESRLVLVDPWQGTTPAFKRGRRNKACVLPAGGEEDLERLLPGVDAAVLRLDADAAPDLAGLLPGAEVRRLAPALFSAWGPPLAVVVRPWRPAAAPVALAGGAGVYAVPAPSTSPGAWLSFSFTAAAGSPVLDRVRFAGRELRVCWRPMGARDRFLTERVPAPAATGPWTLQVGEAGAESSAEADVRNVRLLTWLPPQP